MHRDDEHGGRQHLLTRDDLQRGHAGAISPTLDSIWELGEVNVFDGGADGDVATAPNTLFESQGLFIP